MKEDNEPDYERIIEEREKRHLRDEHVPLEKLKPNPKNPRHHSDFLIDQLTEAISRHGRVNPMIVDEDYNIIAGHARYKAATKLGLKSFPCRIYKWDKNDSKLYGLGDNRLNELSEWNMVFVEQDFLELKDAGVSLEGTGFSEKDLEDMLVGIDFGAPNFDLDESVGQDHKETMVKCPQCGEIFEANSKTKV